MSLNPLDWLTTILDWLVGRGIPLYLALFIVCLLPSLIIASIITSIVAIVWWPKPTPATPPLREQSGGQESATVKTPHSNLQTSVRGFTPSPHLVAVVKKLGFSADLTPLSDLGQGDKLAEDEQEVAVITDVVKKKINDVERKEKHYSSLKDRLFSAIRPCSAPETPSSAKPSEKKEKSAIDIIEEDIEA